jgi:hypothetical protein
MKEVIKPVPQKKPVTNNLKTNLPNKGLKSALPKELIQTKRTGYILATIFVIVIIFGIGMMLFDAMHAFGKLTAISANSVDTPEIDLLIKIGWPWTFLEFNFNDIEKFPLRWGLIIDLIIYFLIAYALDVLTGVFLKSIRKDKKIENKIEQKTTLAKTTGKTKLQ